MAINKIQIDGNTLIDLSTDTAVEADVASGKTFHKADGTLAIGTASGGGTPESFSNISFPTEVNSNE